MRIEVGTVWAMSAHAQNSHFGVEFMRTRRTYTWCAVALLSLAATMAGEKRSHAQVTETLNLGGNYNGNFGYTLNGTSYGGGGPIGPSSLAGNNLSFVYCIDIPDEINVPGTYSNTTVTSNGTAVYGSGNSFASGNSLVSVPNAGAISWLLGQYALGATTSTQQDALQSAIWTEIYDNGTYTGSGAFVLTGDAITNGILAQMQTYLTNVGTAPTSDVFWLSPNGQGNSAVQALVAGTPEPSTFLIAGLSGAGFVFYGLRRRKAMGA